jgi:hypothetical protein
LEEKMKTKRISYSVLSVSLVLAMLLGLTTFLASPTESHAQGLTPSSANLLSGPIQKIPANKSSIRDTTPYFKWMRVTGAVKYQLVVDNNVSFGSPEVNISNITNTYITLGTPLKEGTYYWRVRAMDAKNNWGHWSYIFRFTVDITPPGTPVLLSPVSGTKTTDHTPTFTWKAPTGAWKYVFSIDDNADFSSPVFTSPPVEPTMYNMLFALDSGTYYWRVRARDAAGNWSSWTVAWKLIIK